MVGPDPRDDDKIPQLSAPTLSALPHFYNGQATVKVILRSPSDDKNV